MIVKVKEVTHYTDKLFKITTERPSTFRFHAGEFVMVGMGDYNSAPKRAYSICSVPVISSLSAVLGTIKLSLVFHLVIISPV